MVCGNPSARDQWLISGWELEGTPPSQLTLRAGSLALAGNSCPYPGSEASAVDGRQLWRWEDTRSVSAAADSPTCTEAVPEIVMSQWLAVS